MLQHFCWGVGDLLVGCNIYIEESKYFWSYQKFVWVFYDKLQMFASTNNIYRTRATITRSWLETALEY